MLLVRLPVKWTGWTRWKFLALEPQVERIIRDFRGILIASDIPGLPLTENAPVPSINREKPYVVFAPVASFASKRWPMEHFLALAKKFLQETTHMELVIVAGPQDVHCAQFETLTNNRLINLQGKTKLKESASWLKGAKLVVGNDSGMNHIAEAAGVPVITLFGPTHEAFGFSPHLKESVALSKDMWCRPCSTTGSRGCFRSHQCMTEITPDEVWRELTKRVEVC
jgi:ADP-heptose:LPS heptosyltransferase